MNKVSVVIPTYRREQVLLDTLDFLKALDVPPGEIVVVDQTEHHGNDVIVSLTRRHEEGQIRWIRRDLPSIPQAMNCGLLNARYDIVLFLDDDIRPENGLIVSHANAHESHEDVIVAGRIIQPWDEGRATDNLAPFHFASLKSAWIREFMGGNFSIRRDRAVALGGFDENFVRVAYRFEAEFAFRALAGGMRIRFEPLACIHHLKVVSGGTRTFGEHLTTWRPDHAVGAYYFLLRTWRGGSSAVTFISRLFTSVATRHHFRRPWYVPITLLAELRGVIWALLLFCRGPRLIVPPSGEAFPDA